MGRNAWQRGNGRGLWWRCHGKKKAYGTWALAYWHLIGTTRAGRLADYHDSRGRRWVGHVYTCDLADWRGFVAGETGPVHYHVGRRRQD